MSRGKLRRWWWWWSPSSSSYKREFSLMGNNLSCNNIACIWHAWPKYLSPMMMMIINPFIPRHANHLLPSFIRSNRENYLFLTYQKFVPVIDPRVFFSFGSLLSFSCGEKCHQSSEPRQTRMWVCLYILPYHMEWNRYTNITSFQTEVTFIHIHWWGEGKPFFIYTNP